MEHTGSQHDRRSSPALSLVILCYRAEEYVHEFVRRTIEVLERSDIPDFELILVGNYLEGSDDSTPQHVREAARNDPRIRFCADAKRGWMGWDTRCGLALATGRTLAFIDGDGQMPVSDVVAAYEKIKSGDLDLVKTFRRTRGDGIRRKALSGAFNLIFHLLFPGVNARDINAKPKILTRTAYERLDLVSDDWFLDAEIMIQARRHRFRIAEIPTEFLGLQSRRSFVNFAAVLEFLGNLVRFRIREFRARRGA
jgi:glycosyltransferase involved in cell wall biosynthesis